MGKLGKTIETLSNIAIIVVALLISWVLVKDHVWSKPTRSTAAPSNRPSPSGIEKMVGKTLSLPGIEWSKRSHNIVLAIDSKCHFCSESAPFYKALAAKTSTDSALELVVVSPEQETSPDATWRHLGLP